VFIEQNKLVEQLRVFCRKQPSLMSAHDCSPPFLSMAFLLKQQAEAWLVQGVLVVLLIGTGLIS
jgi:hypothetical protein